MEKTISVGRHKIDLYLRRNGLTHISIAVDATYHKKGVLLGSLFFGFEVWKDVRTTGTD